MLYSVTMKYFDGNDDCYGVLEGKFPCFTLAWKMVNLLKPDDEERIKVYRLGLIQEDDEYEYFKRTKTTYTTCDGARRALNRAPKDSDGNRRLVLSVSWGPDDANEETKVLIIMKAETDKDF